MIISQRGHDTSQFIKYIRPPLPTMPPSLPSHDDHVLYTKYCVEQPRGLLALCHNRECGLGVEEQRRGPLTIITCNSCGWQQNVPTYTTSTESILRRKGIALIEYPQRTFLLEPLSSNAGNAWLRARLEGSTRKGTLAPGGRQGGIGRWKPTEGDDEGEDGVGCQWTPERKGLPRRRRQ